MSFFLNITDVSDEPLHHQISRQLRTKILSGELAEGDGLPSIRGLAKECRVSVITVQRAYEDLDREGLIQARRGKGFFVAQLDEPTKSSLAGDRFRAALTPIVREGMAAGLGETRIRLILDQILSEGESS